MTNLAEELGARMQAVPVGDEAGALVLAACEGTHALSGLVRGQAVEPSPPAGDAAAAADQDVFLRSIAVEGFRGIGPEATLMLQPGPGLTLVVGRNGSGKSSFAEALELLLTGDNQRWAHRSAAWREDWRNVHHTGHTAIRAEFAVSGKGPTVVARGWQPGQGLGDGETTAQHKGEPRRSFSSLGWETGLSLYRPFLSYNELGSILDDGPTKLFDALSSVLGVDDMVAVADRLNTMRKEITDTDKAVKARASRLVERFSVSDDSRVSEAVAALKKRGGPDLTVVEELVTGQAASAGVDSELSRIRALATIAGPDLIAVGMVAAELREAKEALAAFEGTHADSARELAGLLGTAVVYHQSHGDGDCPVCGQSSALNEAWRRRAETKVAELQATAATAEAAYRRVDDALSAARAQITSPPSILESGPARDAWEAWNEAGRISDPTEVAERMEEHSLAVDVALTAVRDRAAAELQLRDDAWRPLVLELAGWLEAARHASDETDWAKPLKEAYDWVQAAASDARNERFAPIAQQAKAIWDLLRQQSHVDLGAIVLEGAKNRRRVVLDVKVDGVAGAALGVMSQGELHALALSLFLPRATLGSSPFRFVVVDDPVQSMDPARVDGLARVLEEVSQSRQVIVFTHDDRLPEALRRLQIPARILEVTRRANSTVEFRNALDPTERALDDARALARTAELPDQVARRVVPGFCRLAIEARCTDIVRRRRLGRGEAHRDVDDALSRADRFGSRVALALFDNPDRSHDDIRARLAQWGRRSVDAFFRSNRGAHQPEQGDLEELIADVTVLVNDLKSVA